MKPKQYLVQVITKAGKFSLPIALLFTIVLNLTLLQIYRYMPTDEPLIVDTAFSVYFGSVIPKLDAWSHIFSEAATINFTYPPLYFYSLGFWMKIFGFSPLATGLFHLLVRIVSIIVFYKLLAKIRVAKWIIIIVCVWWASYSPVVFFISRPDDLAVLFMLLAVSLCVDLPARSSKPLIVSGTLLGIAFLIYPVALIIGTLLCILALMRQNHLKFLQAAYLFSSAGLVSSLWLIWIIPYWKEFRSYFLSFVVVDAGTQDYFIEIFRHLSSLITGVGSDFRFLTSSLPLILFLLFIPFFVKKQLKQRKFQIAVFSSIVIGLLLISRNRIHTYAVGWLVILMLIGLSFLISEVHLDISSPSLSYCLFLVLPSLVILQSFSLLGLQFLHFTANITYQQNCTYNDLLQEIRASIPVREKVITSNGLALYSLREYNVIYWPAGVNGITTGGVPYNARYDDSFKWLITNQLLDEHTDLGAKFSWNADSQRYFLSKFVLVKTIGNLTLCYSKAPLARFSTVSLPIYIYHSE
jgi:hypothetical protein